MKTIAITLSTSDVAIIQKSLLYTAMALQNESHSQQNSPEARDSFVKKYKEVHDILVDISSQCDKQEEQEDSE